MTAQPGNHESTTRRSFLGRIWLWLGGLAILEGAWISTAILRPRKPAARADRDEIVVAGPVDRFEVGTVTAFPAGQVLSQPDRRRRVSRFVAALHPSRLHGPLGGGGGAVHLPVPRLVL